MAQPKQTKRLAIIGCGSSGLIMLKQAIDHLSDWEIVCFERNASITGVWGNPYPGFVSTSTRYTTQFVCFPQRDASVEDDGGASRAEFFRNGEYGQYLNQFADAFRLRSYIKLQHEVEQLTRDVDESGWQITYRNNKSNDNPAPQVEHFDQVVICTGLTAKSKPLDSAVPTLTPKEMNCEEGLSQIRRESIVVFGGGESAVDYAVRLAKPELENKVYLSLRSGVRVSPRYHPIRGVPSDFLRNRLMLSIHPSIRNWIGQRFVKARMLHQERFEKWFPARAKAIEQSEDELIAAKRKQWAHRLTAAAKDDLFNMFHNKSDDFLDAVARGRIEIIGSPVDRSMQRFHEFDGDSEVDVSPTKVVPAVGYHSTLDVISGGELSLSEFYLGCVHAQRPDLYLVGFARPVIGNIPSISEIQAAYIARLLSGEVKRPADIEAKHVEAQAANKARFSHVDLETIYPVEMFPYCDYLAQRMGIYPTISKVGSIRDWVRMQLAPATTAHYFFHDRETREYFAKAPIYLPTIFIGLLVMLKPIDWLYRGLRRLRARQVAHLPS